jgi:rSAM/selenodomain-associated transferase 1
VEGEGPSATVALFTRAPVRGRVKTRLAAVIGEDAALALHRALLERAVSALRDAPDFDLVLHLDGDAATLPPWRVPVTPQSDGDLGARMFAAIAAITGQGRIAVVVGSDCPGLEARHVRAAVRAVRDGADVALCAAEDGGYVLIAMARLHRRVFEDVDWGTARVLEQTRARAREEGVVLTELETLWDVDTAADLARYRDLIADSRDVRSS